jgi:Tfp pilus assembly protein PilO
MNSKTVNYVLTVLLVGALGFAFYTKNKAEKHEADNKMWESKYEEAIDDAQESSQRIEKMKEELEKALSESETHRKAAEEALADCPKKKR